MQEVQPVVSQELFCSNCCIRQSVIYDGQQYRCTLCRNIVTPPTDLAACPRSPSGRHNYWRGACSQCGVEMEAPVGADTYYVGSPR